MLLFFIVSIIIKPMKDNTQKRNIPIHSQKGSSEDFFLSPYGTDDQEFFSQEGQLACDIYQDHENIYIKSTMAGVDPNNLDIAVSNDLITIRGFREESEEIKEEDFYAREIYWGSFSRSIVLPQEIEQKKIEAILKNGVLIVKLPKKYKTSSIKVRQIDD